MHNLQDVIDKEIDRVLKVYEDFKKKEIDPIAQLGSPEKIIGRPYKQWNEKDKQLLREVYIYSPEDLEEFITKKEVDAVWSIQDINKRLGV